MRTIQAVVFLVAFGLLMAQNSVGVEDGKRSLPGERLAPETLEYGGATYNARDMKAYFLGNRRDPFKQGQTRPKPVIRGNRCGEF